MVPQLQKYWLLLLLFAHLCFTKLSLIDGDNDHIKFIGLHNYWKIQ